MFARKAICAYIIAILLNGTALAASEDRSHLSSDPRVNGARALIESGRFDEALTALRPLAPDHPDRTDVLFLVGLAALKASQRPGTGDEERNALLDEAIAAFRAILIDHPRLVRVRLELARAFFLKREDDLSRDHFERVLAGKPHPAIAANIRRFLDTIWARRRWSGYLNVTIAPDSNINAASDERIIYIYDLPFRRSTDAGASSGMGTIISGGTEYQYPLGEQLRLRAGADVAHREYAGKDFDQTYLSAHFGPRWQANADTEINLLGSAHHRWTAGEPQNRELGVRFEIEHRVNRQFTVRGRMSWHQRTYRQNALLNGPASDLSLGAAWLLKSTVRLDATVGYRHERPKSVVWRNSGQWAQLGISVALPYGFTLGAGGELHWTKFQGQWFPYTPTGARREDRTRIIRASVFNRAFTLYGFSPQLVLVNELRDSNAQLYGYKRNRAELGFVRQF